MIAAASGQDNGFGDALGDAARAIIADARQTLADTTIPDAQAVHDLRKAFKRWRALLRLLARPLGEQADLMRGEARDLMRSLAQARDVQAALDALADLRKTEIAFSPTSMETISTRLTQIKEMAETATVTPQMRTRLNGYLDYATLALDRWLLQEIGFATVAEGLTDTYRRARQLVPDQWPSATPGDLHNLRRRVVEHRHQLELIAPLWPRLAEVWANEAQRLRNRLGACQDLAVFTNLTAPHQPLAHWRSRLAPLIAARKAAHAAAAARLAARLFAEKPKAFHRRIEGLWKARGE